MKTKDLVRKLEKIDGVKIYHQDYISLSMNEIKIASVGTIGQWLDIFTNCPDEVAKLLFEYYLTPLEEREEEKLYYLKMPKGFNDNNLYVLKNHSSDNYFTKAYNFEDYKYAFTQKEIDAMPFDTSFFIKEEVL